MANQTNSSVIDPAQERKTSAWKQYDQTPSSKLPKALEPPAWFEHDQSFQDLMTQFGREQSRPESKPVEGEINLGMLTEPAHIDLTAAGYEPPKELDDLGLNFPRVPDMFSRAVKAPESLVPAIPPEEIERRRATDQAQITQASSVLVEMMKIGREVAREPGRMVTTAEKQLLTLLGAPVAPAEEFLDASKEKRLRNRKDALDTVMGKGRQAQHYSSELLARGIMTAARERTAHDEQREKMFVEETTAAALPEKQDSTLLDGPLAATGAKQKRGLLGMFGARKKKAVTWFTGLKNKFVQLGHVIKKWLGGEQQAANRQG